MGLRARVDGREAPRLAHVRLAMGAVAEASPPPREQRPHRAWRSFFTSISLVMSLSVSVLFIAFAANAERAIEAEFETRARTLFNSIVLAREWNGAYGGV